MLKAEQELMYGKALSLGLQVEQKMLQLQLERGMNKNDTISDEELGTNIIIATTIIITIIIITIIF
jgi:hypothetical protein